MKWVLLIGGILVGLVALVAAIGALLPRNHVATRAAKFKQSPQTIWDTITDIAAAPSWRPEVQSVEKLPDRNGHTVWAEVSKMGRMTYEVTVSEPPSRLVTQIADENLPFGGNWTYEISEAEGGSLLTITENGEIYNPFFRFMARFIFGYHATLETYLKNLGKKFGEEITIITAP
jgi:uncharacterized protein YndB with AHSA1/START domain